MRDGFGGVIFVVWQLAAVATTIYLIVEDWADFTWWNWVILIPIDFFLGEIWPIYWLILRPIFGG